MSEQKNIRKQVRRIKLVVIGALTAMIITDVVLVFSEARGFPTFSRVFREHRTELMWMNFVYGGLMAKIFFNRKVKEKYWDYSGFLTFTLIAAMLFVLGQIMVIEVDTPYQLMILVCGGVLAYRVWPQYSS